ncbi:MAG: plastocyanin/azurin family copper-binding protein [Gemmatimonadaceae bacterium]
MRPILASALALGVFHTNAENHIVSQKNKSFSQGTLSVRVGEQVVFKNDDAVPHNIFSGSAGFAFNLKAQTPGTESSTTFDKAGTVEVRCAFHPTMKLTVTVAP